MKYVIRISITSVIFVLISGLVRQSGEQSGRLLPSMYSGLVEVVTVSYEKALRNPLKLYHPRNL